MGVIYITFHSCSIRTNHDHKYELWWGLDLTWLVIHFPFQEDLQQKLCTLMAQPYKCKLKGKPLLRGQHTQKC